MGARALDLCRFLVEATWPNVSVKGFDKGTDAVGSVREGVSASGQLRENRFGVIHTPAPGPAAGLLKRRPEPGVIRQLRGGRQVFAGRSGGKNAFPFFRRKSPGALT